jgi:hypothetical protein
MCQFNKLNFHRPNLEDNFILIVGFFNVFRKCKSKFRCVIFWYYILLLFTIFKIVNTDKIYFLKLYLDSLENMRQN